MTRTYSEILSYLEKDKILHDFIKTVEHPVKPSLNVDIYYALLESIVSQQLSTKVVRIIWQRFLDLFPDGYPIQEHLIYLDEQTLRKAGLSFRKINYLKNVAEFSLENNMTFEYLHQKTDEEIIAYLTTIKGVGKWTVQMILMFPMDRLDVFPVDDLGIQQAMKKMYNIDLDKKILKPKLIEISETWKPYRSLASKYLWRFVN